MDETTSKRPPEPLAAQPQIINGPFSGPSGHIGQNKARYLSEFSLRYRAFLVAGTGFEPATSGLSSRRFAHVLRVRLEWMDFQLRWRFRAARSLSPAAVEACVARCLLSFAPVTGNRTLGSNGAVTSVAGDAAMTGFGTVRGNRGIAGNSSNDAVRAVINSAPVHD